MSLDGTEIPVPSPKVEKAIKAVQFAIAAAEGNKQAWYPFSLDEMKELLVALKETPVS